MPSLKPIRLKKKPRRKSIRAKKEARATWWTSTPTILGAAVSLTVGAVLIAAYESSEPMDPTIVKTAATARLDDIDGANTTPSSGSVRPRGVAGAARELRTPALKPAAAEAVAVTGDAGSASEAVPPPVTLTGCLVRADDVYRLKDTTGESAPRVRSWKSGFLRKRAASIEVVDASDRVKLSKHVGERVRITGNLVDRRMTVRSLERVGASCDGGAKVKA